MRSKINDLSLRLILNAVPQALKMIETCHPVGRVSYSDASLEIYRHTPFPVGSGSWSIT